MEIPLIKIAVFGEVGVGKFSTCHRYVKNGFIPNLPRYKGMDYEVDMEEDDSIETGMRFTDFLRNPP